MQPKPRSAASQFDLFQAQFDQLLNLSHPLYQLAAKIDWKRFDVAFAACYCPEISAPAKAFGCWLGCIICSTRSTNRTNPCWIAGSKIRTGSPSVAAKRCNMKCHCIPLP